MTCPSCGERATTFFRHAFSWEGASFSQSLKGQFRCKHCGVLLRTKNYGKYFWPFYISTIVSLVLLYLVFTYIPVDPGILWVGFFTAVFIAFLAGIYRGAILEEVPSEGGAVEKDSEE